MDRDASERRQGYDDIMQSRFCYMRRCPQCEAQELRATLIGPLRPYGIGMRLAALAVLTQPHECGKSKEELP